MAKPRRRMVTITQKTPQGNRHVGIFYYDWNFSESQVMAGIQATVAKRYPQVQGEYLATIEPPFPDSPLLVSMTAPVQPALTQAVEE